MRARTGKIARLPGPIRHELNRCLHNGTLGKEFDIWLNELAEVQCVPAHCFPGRLVTEDNISAWRQGGFRDWLRFHPESGLLGPSGAYQQGGWGPPPSIASVLSSRHSTLDTRRTPD